MSDAADESEFGPHVAEYPRGELPALRVRDLPEPLPLRKMIGPSIMLAGLALGSGEFIFWPYLTYKSGFIFFWACVIGVVTQYFLNMEITRWALVTGESAVTGFARLSKHWAGLFLFLNIVPWMIPAWARGTSEMISWLIFRPELGADGSIHAPYIPHITVATLLLCGFALTTGPVIYETVERIQLFLVSFLIFHIGFSNNLVFTCGQVRTDKAVFFIKEQEIPFTLVKVAGQMLTSGFNKFTVHHQRNGWHIP